MLPRAWLSTVDCCISFISGVIHAVHPTSHAQCCLVLEPTCTLLPGAETNMHLLPGAGTAAIVFCIPHNEYAAIFVVQVPAVI